MEEAERLCDRVAIVDQGRIIALGPPKDLIAQLGGDHVIEFSMNGDSLPDARPEHWSDLLAVTGSRIESGAVHLSVTEPHVALPALLERLESRDWQLASLTTRHASLDDVFVMLTGRQLEEADGASE
jgi:ABC-2 type transport system ATP-binding protein